MNTTLQYKINFKSSPWLSFIVFIYVASSFAQVSSTIDSTAIKIGEQITFKVAVVSDTTEVVIFPEGQSFLPLEMIESYKTDTTKNDATYQLVKKYGLTQFDSGTYTIPRQKIIIGSKIVFTDSLKIEVHNIEVDTTKQGLYDIKPFIDVERGKSNWFKYLIWTLVILSIIGGLLYWFIWRKKPLSEEEKIALLLPYDRAKLALKTLDESNYLQQSALKKYYSELTFIIRRYLDEKVYDHALESTTDELIDRLRLLKDGNQIDISKDDINKIETILKRADLVKFAKSEPDIALAEIDRNTIDLEIDHVKEALPEPTEEEKLLNEQYKEEQERKQNRRKIWLTGIIIIGLLIATFIGFGLKYGFTYVKDTIIGHENKELLEGHWVTSDYGFPPVTISTPNVLKRIDAKLSDDIEKQMDMTSFTDGTFKDAFSISVITTKLKQNPQEEVKEIDLNQASEASITELEKLGAKDIIVQRDKFTTPNTAEGLKTFGTLKFPGLTDNSFVNGEYVLLQFTAENVLQQIVITWRQEDTYADRIVERILNSVELNKVE